MDYREVINSDSITKIKKFISANSESLKSTGYIQSSEFITIFINSIRIILII